MHDDGKGTTGQAAVPRACGEIAVVIPAYNGAATVARAVRSCVQDDVVVDIVVVDDGSTDDTAAVAAAVDAPRLQVITQPNAGVCAARNVGAASTDAPYLVFLDADDELLDGSLRRFLDSAGGAPLIRAAITIERDGIDELHTAEPPHPTLVHPRGTKATGSFAVSHDAFDRSGGYDTALRYGENTELLLRLGVLGRAEGWQVPVIAEPAARIYRQTVGRSDRYGSAPADAARYLLERYRSELADDREILGDYSAIVGTHLWRTGGRRRDVARWWGRAVAARPASPVAWGRLTRLALPRRPTR